MATAQARDQRTQRLTTLAAWATVLPTTAAACTVAWLFLVAALERYGIAALIACIWISTAAALAGLIVLGHAIYPKHPHANNTRDTP